MTGALVAAASGVGFGLFQSLNVRAAIYVGGWVAQTRGGAPAPAAQRNPATAAAPDS